MHYLRFKYLRMKVTFLFSPLQNRKLFSRSNGKHDCERLVHQLPLSVEYSYSSYIAFYMFFSLTRYINQSKLLIFIISLNTII